MEKCYSKASESLREAIEVFGNSFNEALKSDSNFG